MVFLPQCARRTGQGWFRRAAADGGTDRFAAMSRLSAALIPLFHGLAMSAFTCNRTGLHDGVLKSAGQAEFSRRFGADSPKLDFVLAVVLFVERMAISFSCDLCFDDCIVALAKQYSVKHYLVLRYPLPSRCNRFAASSSPDARPREPVRAHPELTPIA